MLEDSAEIQRDDAGYISHQRAKKHLPPVEPLYTTRDAEKCVGVVGMQADVVGEVGDGQGESSRAQCLGAAREQGLGESRQHVFAARGGLVGDARIGDGEGKVTLGHVAAGEIDVGEPARAVELDDPLELRNGLVVLLVHVELLPFLHQGVGGFLGGKPGAPRGERGDEKPRHHRDPTPAPSLHVTLLDVEAFLSDARSRRVFGGGASQAVVASPTGQLTPVPPLPQ